MPELINEPARQNQVFGEFEVVVLGGGPGGTTSKPQVAETLVQSVRRTVTIAGFPLSAWLFALRIWAAMMVGLYAAFWLQLESASSAAVTVGILALPTRGQAYHKAAYRILATIVGVVASIVIAGLFAQSRILFVIGFAGWLGLCVYAGGLLDGDRAYSAVLSGYTVALVAESGGGAARGAAARSAAVALVAEVSAASALASLPVNTLPSFRGALGEALADGLEEESRTLQPRLQRLADVGDTDPHDALFARHALDLLIENRRGPDPLHHPPAGAPPPPRLPPPHFPPPPAAGGKSP